MKGKVVRVLGDKYFGFIKGEDNKEYFFHYTGLKNEDFNQALEGRVVDFEPTNTSKGLRAEDIYVS
jgi:CspA family cold shock protein